MRGTLVFVVAMALAVSGAASGQDTVDLRPKFEAGQQTRFEFVTDGTRLMKAPGVTDAARAQKSRQAFTTLLKVTEATPESAKADLVFEKILMEVDLGRQQGKFDSSAPSPGDASDPLASVLRPWVGKTMTVHFGPDGQVNQVSGALDATPGSPMGQAASALIGGKQVQSRMNRVLSLKRAPSTAKVGESWTNEDIIELGMAGSMTLTSTNTLASVSDGIARINMEGTLKLNQGAAGAELKKGTYTGHALWDVKAGMLSSMEFEQVIDLGIMGSELSSTAKTTVRRIDAPAGAGR